jgi:Flp pilus assembly protein TadB
MVGMLVSRSNQSDSYNIKYRKEMSDEEATVRITCGEKKTIKILYSDKKKRQNSHQHLSAKPNLEWSPNKKATPLASPIRGEEEAIVVVLLVVLRVIAVVMFLLDNVVGSVLLFFIAACFCCCLVVMAAGAARCCL